jgi:tetratricopeptide (TPR) repeat protein
MISANSPQTLREARLNALAELSEWQKLLTHFDLEPDQFAFIPVLVPDSDWEEVCRQSLAELLRAFEKKELYVIALEKPEELKNLAVTIFDLELEKNKYAAVWIAAPVTLRDDEREDWQAAWREGMARLNQYRNPFRRKFDFPVLLVGAEWTQQIIRDAAPDLWSVRTIVLRIEPPIVSAADVERVEKVSPTGISSYWRNVDPEFALREAARLRGQNGKEFGLARLLYRAAKGFSARAKFKQAIEAVQEADDLVGKLLTQSSVKSINNKDILNRSELESFWATIINTKGVALAQISKLNEAILEFDKAIEIRRRLIEEENRDDLANDLATTLMNKGTVLLQLGKLNEAILELDKAIKIRWELIEEENHDEIANQLATALTNKGAALAELSKLNEAIEEYDKAIEIRRRLVEEENRDDLANHLATTFMNKGNALADLDKLNEAIEEYDKAIEIRRRLVEEENRDDLANDLATTLMNKSTVFASLGKLNEAIDDYDKAIAIYQRLVEEENRDDLANHLAGTFMNKGNALGKLGKPSEAIDEYDNSERIRRGCLKREEFHVLPYYIQNIRNRIAELIKLENWERIANDTKKVFEIYEQVEKDNNFSDYFNQQIGKEIGAILYFLRQVSPENREKIYAAAGDNGEFLRQFVESNQ